MEQVRGLQKQNEGLGKMYVEDTAGANRVIREKDKKLAERKAA